MPAERRNLYRLLHVQPEAPPEVIKAAWRALMSTLRAHPDLGGDTETAARLNAAYAVLSDPEQRRLYDLGLRRPARSAAARLDPLAWRAERRCPLCGHPLAGQPRAGLRCSACTSPLAPAPEAAAAAGPTEPQGRRAAARQPRDQAVALHLPGRAAAQPARLCDLSFSGLALQCREPVPRASALRVVAPAFDAVAVVVGCRAMAGGHRVHARLLTLELTGPRRGVVLNARA